MFRHRVITGLVLAPLVLGFIIFSRICHFEMGMVVLFLFIVLEWGKLVPLNRLWEKAIFLLFSFAVGWLEQAVIIKSQALYLEAALWGLIYGMIMTYPKTLKFWDNRFVVAIMGAMILPSFCLSLVDLKQLEHGNSWLLYLIFTVWAADTGAYLAGRRFGRHKLIPNVSPNKTIEGVFGAFILSLPLTIVMYYLVPLQHPIITWALLYPLLVISSIFGDLFISMLKRRVNLKDVSNLLPGHGGLLDRLDSLLSASFMLIFCQSFIHKAV